MLIGTLFLLFVGGSIDKNPLCVKGKLATLYVDDWGQSFILEELEHSPNISRLQGVGNLWVIDSLFLHFFSLLFNNILDSLIF
jgi:hypothetical protein